MSLFSKFIVGLLCSILFQQPVFAGSSQAGGEAFFEPEKIISFAKKVEKSLAANGARVAILARVGRNRESLPEGINFTHTAIAVYSKITTADGRTIPGYSIYNLYQKADKPDESELLQDYPVDFFAGVQVLEAGIIIPSPELQIRLLKTFGSEINKKLHNSKYSVIANPFTQDLQNCTEHTLDILFAAIYETDDIEQIKVNEKAYFEPQPVTLNPLKLILGSMFVADVAISDHPDNPVTATFTTIGRFLEKFKAVSKIYSIKADG